MNNAIIEFRDKYRWLSNFYICDVKFDGIMYPSVEHAYQAAKSLDKDYRTTIRNMGNPGAVKKFGRQCVLRDDWNNVKIEIMHELLKEKFSNSALKDMLLATGNVELIEGNYWNDTFWGVCNGVGQNVLGKLLMKVREELRNG